MAIQLKCVKSDGKGFDITPLVNSIRWSGDKNSCSRKLEFDIVASANDKNVPKFDIPLSSLILFFEDGKQLFRGFVYDRSLSSGGNSTSFTCFDYAEKLNKIKVSYNIKNKTAQDVFRMILKDHGYEVDKDVAGDSTKITDVFINETIHDVVMECYRRQGLKSGKPYMIFAKDKRLGTRVRGAYATASTFEEGKNIISSDFSESTQNMVTKVIIIDEKGNKKGEVIDSENRKIHGLFQEMYQIEEGKDSKVEAKAMLKGVENSCSLEGYGDTSCLTGFCVKVQDSHTGLVGKFYIDSDTHTWQGGNYTISLGLNFENLVDKKEIASSSAEKETTSNKGSSSSSSGSSSSIGSKIVDVAKSKLGCKYVWGASGENTFDCSGLTSYCHKKVGITIPRTSSTQRTGGKKVNQKDAQLGDIVCFEGHVGLYAGNGQMIHAPNPNEVVKYDSCFSGYWGKKVLAIRRYY